MHAQYEFLDAVFHMGGRFLSGSGAGKQGCTHIGQRMLSRFPDYDLTIGFMPFEHGTGADAEFPANF